MLIKYGMIVALKLGILPPITQHGIEFYQCKNEWKVIGMSFEEVNIFKLINETCELLEDDDVLTIIVSINTIDKIIKE